MGNGRHILDHGYFQSGCLKSANGGFTASSRSLHHDFDRLQAMLHSSLGGCLRGHLCGIGGILAGSTESQTAGACPGKGVARRIGERYDCIIKRRLNMRLSLIHILADTATRRCFLRYFLSANFLTSYLFLLVGTVLFGPLRVRALVFVF